MTSPESPARRRGPMRIPYDIAVGGTLALLVGLSVAQALEPPEIETHVTALADDERPNETPIPVTLEALTCFTCHSLETYHNGDGGQAFPHDFHLDMLGIEGCHECHAFDDHAPVFGNQEVCADCH